MHQNLSRRRFLQSSGTFVGVAGLAHFLASCGGDDSGSTTTAPGTTGASATTLAPAAADFGELKYALNWVADVSSAGAFIADTRGYYLEGGFSSVSMTPGGPGAPAAEAAVTSGTVLIGSSGPDSTAAAIEAGAKVTIIGAQLQKNPLCILSLADNPLSVPQDMVGKTIGLVDGISNAWESFLAANDLDPSSITVVPAGYDPTPLTVGDWDGYVAYATNEPASLELAGFPTEVMLWADFGYKMVTQTYVVNTADLVDKRDMIKAVLLADIRGWRDNIAEPEVAPGLVVDKYGKDLGLTVEHQVLVNQNQTALMVTPDTDANGLFTITPERIDEVVSTLSSAGKTVDPAVLFDMSVLSEIYAEHPDLKTPVTPG